MREAEAQEEQETQEKEVNAQEGRERQERDEGAQGRQEEEFNARGKPRVEQTHDMVAEGLMDPCRQRTTLANCNEAAKWEQWERWRRKERQQQETQQQQQQRSSSTTTNAKNMAFEGEGANLS